MGPTPASPARAATGEPPPSRRTRNRWPRTSAADLLSAACRDRAARRPPEPVARPTTVDRALIVATMALALALGLALGAAVARPTPFPGGRYDVAPPPPVVVARGDAPWLGEARDGPARPLAVPRFLASEPAPDPVPAAATATPLAHVGTAPSRDLGTFLVGIDPALRGRSSPPRPHGVD
jgi:hypothetical protein